MAWNLFGYFERFLSEPITFNVISLLLVRLIDMDSAL